MTSSRYEAYRRLCQLLPALASAHVAERELEVLRQAGEDLLLMRRGEEHVAVDSVTQAADVLGMLVGTGELDQAQAELLLDLLAGCGGSEPLPSGV
jgi:hypothetical protein